jgi:DNA-binding response OmpR family regulator
MTGGAATLVGTVAIVTRVLIVDDEQPVRSALERILSAMGYELIAAVDGLDAQARLSQLPIDLVITDLSMPDADGFAVLHAVRELRSGLPVIVLTGRGSTQDCVGEDGNNKIHLCFSPSRLLAFLCFFCSQELA